MTKRKGAGQHYEKLFENELRESGVLYLAIDETKRPIYETTTIKNFDFIVSSFNGKFLIDIKGKKFPYGRSSFWENWIKTDDITGLKLWATHFNAFIPLLVYPYLLMDKSYEREFTDIFEFKRHTYGVVAIELSMYYVNAKPRSPKWDAISVPKEKFKTITKPISFFIPELRRKW